MASHLCILCGSSFRTTRALATYKATCIGNKIPHVKSSSRGRSIHRPRDFAPLNFVDIVGPSESIELNELVQFHLDNLNLNDYDDCIEEEFLNFLSQEAPTSRYNSNLSLVRWIRIVKKSTSLSNVDIDKLFTNVLLHPNFKLDDVSLKSAYDVDKFERSFYSEEDGWIKKDIGEHVLCYRDPVNALESLFFSPMFAENFILKLEICDCEEKEYSTPATGNWWHSMQTSV